jgi:hypothetical protein
MTSMGGKTSSDFDDLAFISPSFSIIHERISRRDLRNMSRRARLSAILLRRVCLAIRVIVFSYRPCPLTKTLGLKETSWSWRYVSDIFWP